MKVGETKKLTDWLWVHRIDEKRYLITNRERRVLLNERNAVTYLKSHLRNDSFVPLGDYLEKTLASFGIESCMPCIERQARLNRLVPRGRRK